MADKSQSTTWSEVKAALEAGDADKIARLKEWFFNKMEQNARKFYLKRLAVQSVMAATFGDILLELKADENNKIATFKHQLLMDYSLKHGLTVYTDVSQIQQGDSIVTTWKDKKQVHTQTFRVIERSDNNWLISLAMWENDESQFKAHERAETISNKNFVVGVRQQNPPAMRKPQTFYFLKFND